MRVRGLVVVVAFAVACAAVRPLGAQTAYEVAGSSQSAPAPEPAKTQAHESHWVWWVVGLAALVAIVAVASRSGGKGGSGGGGY